MVSSIRVSPFLLLFILFLVLWMIDLLHLLIVVKVNLLITIMLSHFLLVLDLAHWVILLQLWIWISGSLILRNIVLRRNLPRVVFISLLFFLISKLIFKLLFLLLYFIPIFFRFNINGGLLWIQQGIFLFEIGIGLIVESLTFNRGSDWIEHFLNIIFPLSNNVNGCLFLCSWNSVSQAFLIFVVMQKTLGVNERLRYRDLIQKEEVFRLYFILFFLFSFLI